MEYYLQIVSISGTHLAKVITILPWGGRIASNCFIFCSVRYSFLSIFTVDITMKAKFSKTLSDQILLLNREMPSLKFLLNSSEVGLVKRH